MDDIIYTRSSQSLVDEFKLGMMNTFEMSYLGLLHYLSWKLNKEKKQYLFLKRTLQKDYSSVLIYINGRKYCEQ